MSESGQLNAAPSGILIPWNLITKPAIERYRTRVFDGKNYERLEQGPGQVLDRFLPARAAPLASAAQ